MSNIIDLQRMQNRGFNPPMFKPQSPQPFTGTPGYGPDSQFRPEGDLDMLGLAAYLPMIAGDLAMAFKAPKYDTEVRHGDWSGYNPQHGLGDEIQRAQSIDTDQVITRNTGQTALKFAGTGASIGGSILPGVGHAIGAGIGAITGAVAGFFGGRRKKRKAEEQRNEILSKVAQQAEAFSDVNIKAKTEQQRKRIALQNYYAR